MYAKNDKHLKLLCTNSILLSNKGMRCKTIAMFSVCLIIENSVVFFFYRHFRGKYLCPNLLTKQDLNSLVMLDFALLIKIHPDIELVMILIRLCYFCYK